MKIGDVIFEVTLKTKVFKRFDTSHAFWERFNERKPKRQKKLGLYEVDNLCYVTLAVNPKEYFELFRDYSINKKHKDIKKRIKGNGIPKLRQ